MKKKIVLFASLILVICCFLAITVSAAQCQDGCTDNWTLTEGEQGYLGSIDASNVCPDCGTVIGEETIAPMFATNGYSYNETSGGMTQHFAVNREAVDRYCQITGKNVRFGAVTAIKEALGGGNHAVNSNGEPINGNVLVADMTDRPFDIFDIMVNDIPGEYKDSAAIICSAYVIIDGVVTYIENGTVSDVAVANTYNQVVKIVDKIEDDDEEAVEKDSLKILTIGNSFSDDAMEYAYYIAKAAGYKSVELGNIRRDSCSLETHVSAFKSDSSSGYIFRHWVDGATAWDHVWGVNNAQCAASPKDVFELGIEWDYVVFQQVSTSTDYSALSELIELVKPYCPNAKLAWHMTWALKNDNGTGYDNIVNAVKTQILPIEDIDIIIPTGAAIQNAKASAISNDLIYRPDGKHLSYGLGRYIAGLTLIKTLTGCSIDNMVPPTIDTEGNSLTTGRESAKPSFGYTESINEMCISAANAAVTNPPVQIAVVLNNEEE